MKYLLLIFLLPLSGCADSVDDKWNRLPYAKLANGNCTSVMGLNGRIRTVCDEGSEEKQ